MRAHGPRTLVLATTLLLLFTACGDAGTDAPAPDPAATTASAPETTRPTAPQPTEPAPEPAAPEPEPAPTVPVPTVPDPEPEPGDALRIGYRVVGVAADDVLNVRAGPSAEDTIVGELAHDATGVVVDSRRSSDDPWWKVMLEDGTVGWAHSRYLELDERWNASFDELACGGAAMDAGPQRASAAASNAHFVHGFEFLTSPDCDRLVIRLGTRLGMPRPPDFPSIAADRVPGGVEVATAGNHVLVTLPLETAWGEETAVFDDALLLVGYAEPAEDWGTFTARLIYASDRVAHARFLDDPARIVVDVRPAPDSTGADMSPVVHGDAILTEPALWDGTLPGARQPLTVTGFGRAFESTLFISLDRVDGGPVDASWSGGYDCGEDPGGSHCTMSSGSSVWGSFAFTIDGLEPGDYVLSMTGECMADEVGEAACAAAVLHHPFTVHADAGTAAAALAPFFSAAERLDREIAAAAATFNAGYDPAAGTVSLAAQRAIRALRLQPVAAAIPPGMSPELERAVLAVYADLDSRIAALEGVVRHIPEGSTVVPMPEDVPRCLTNGSRSKARFGDDLALARSLAARAPAPTGAPDSVAAGVLAVRLHVIELWNTGCDGCGGAEYDVTLPVDWDGRLVDGRVSFEAAFVGGSWEVAVNAC